MSELVTIRDEFLKIRSLPTICRLKVTNCYFKSRPFDGPNWNIKRSAKIASALIQLAY